MKQSKFVKLLIGLLILALLSSALLLASCVKRQQPVNQDDNGLSEEPKPENPVISSEKAMENFFKKIEVCNYVVDNESGVKITVFSKDLVYFSGKNNLVYMTVNGQGDDRVETFVGILDDDLLTKEDISFYGEGHAVEAISEKLLNCWGAIAGGNVWDLFTNFPEEPLKFQIIGEDLKLQILENFSGMGAFSSDRPDEMFLWLESEDPTSAEIKITFESGTNPIRIAIQFGVERPDTLPSDAWVKDSAREYPDRKAAWDEADEVVFNAVFNQGYDVETELMPFPNFATYAFLRDPFSTEYYNQIWIRDSRATREGMEEYIQKLLDLGFLPATETLEDGSERNCYHKVLKDFGDGFYSYSSIYLEYDDGVNIVTRRYYNHKDYEGLDAINSLLTAKGFLPLTEADGLTRFDASDFTYEFLEGLASLFTYDLVLDVNIQYEDEEAAQAYLDAYLEAILAAGYRQVGEELYELDSEVYQNKFSYNPEYRAAGMLQIRFKGQKYLSRAEANAAIEAAGFPGMELENYQSTSKEITTMYKIMYNLDHRAVYSVALSFETSDDMIAFMDSYIDGKLLSDGFESVMNPLTVKVPYKEAAYYNAEKGLIVAFNVPSLDSTFVTFHMIWVSDDFTPLS